MKQLILFLAIGVISFSLSAQNDNIKKINITEFSVLVGGNSGNFQAGSFEEMKKLAPGSVILEDDLSGFSFYNGNQIISNSTYSALLGIRFANSEKTGIKHNPLFRIGISYNSGFVISRSAYKDERYPYDTITSSQTGQMYVYDSVYSNSYHIRYGQEQLKLDVSILFRTKSQSRWMLYSGMGLTAGFGMNSHTEVIHSERSYLSQVPYNINPNFQGVSNSKNEEFSNRTSINYSAYLPLGVDFRIGKNHDFWRQIHLFLEPRPGINFVSIPEIGTFNNVFIQTSLGIMVAWN